MKSILIMGLGYTARAFIPLFQGQYEIQTASRSSDADFQFDYVNPETWNELPTSDIGIITFPLKPFANIEAFSKILKTKFKRVVVIGTTGSIDVEYDNQVVTENSVFDESQERVQSENYLLKSGANLIHSAGIYGEGRDPRNWVMRGLVGPEDRFVNFIHVEDLCRFILAASEAGESGKRYIASDSSPQKWSDLIERWKREYNLVVPAEFKKSQRKSKQIDASESIKSLGVQIKFSSIHEGLCEIGF